VLLKNILSEYRYITFAGVSDFKKRKNIMKSPESPLCWGDGSKKNPRRNLHFLQKHEYATELRLISSSKKAGNKYSMKAEMEIASAERFVLRFFWRCNESRIFIWLNIFMQLN
jgi:hypothetical protein